MFYNKRRKLQGSFTISNKRNRCYDYVSFNISNKKNKSIYCLIHEYSYICDMYDCSGIKKLKKQKPNIFMPYIN